MRNVNSSLTNYQPFKLVISEEFNSTGLIGDNATWIVTTNNTISVVIEGVGSGNIVEVQARILGQTNFTTVATIAGLSSGTPVDISLFDQVRFNCTTFSASGVPKLIASSFFSWVGGSLSGVSSLNSLTGAVVLAAGANITLTPSGNTITIASTGGGGGTPASPDKSIQFNNSGSFGGSSDLTWDYSNGFLGVGTDNPIAVVDVSTTEANIKLTQTVTYGSNVFRTLAMGDTQTFSDNVDKSSILAGHDHFIGANDSVICAGASNNISIGSGDNYNSGILAGNQNIVTNYGSGIIAGHDHSLTQHFGFIGAGGSNIIDDLGTDTGYHCAIVAGESNVIHGAVDSVIVAGTTNVIGDSLYPNILASVIVAGGSNTILSSNAAIVSGTSSKIWENSNYSFIGAGNAHNNKGTKSAIVAGDTSTIGSSSENKIGAGEGHIIDDGSNRNFIGAGSNATIGSGSYGCAVVSGEQNTIEASSCQSSGIFTGYNNTIHSSVGWSMIGAGQNNQIGSSTQFSTIITGDGNYIGTSVSNSLVGGGDGNYVSDNLSSVVIVGGSNNIALAGANSSTICGGRDNQTVGEYSCVVGGVGASAERYGQRSHASGYIGFKGDAQETLLTLRAQCNGPTTQELFLDGSSIVISHYSTSFMAGTIEVSAYNLDGSGECAHWQRRFIVTVDASNVVTLATLQISAADMGSNAGAPPEAWTLLIDDNSGANLRIRVQNTDSTNINCAARVIVTEILF